VYFAGHGSNDPRGRQLLCPIESGALFGESTVNLQKDILDALRPDSNKCQQSTGLQAFELNKRNCNVVIVEACRADEDTEKPVLHQKVGLL
jgi:hypothetical protein